jgi:hypothetical protein
MEKETTRKNESGKRRMEINEVKIDPPETLLDVKQG